MALLHNDLAIHVLMPNAAVLGANIREFTRFVEGAGQFGNLSGQYHHVDVRILDFETVLNISAGHIEGDGSPNRDGDFARVVAPGARLSQNMRFIFARSQFTTPAACTAVT